MSNLRANQARNALIKYEAAQELIPLHEMMNTGDNQIFRADDAPWSDVPGFEPVVHPNGIATGAVVNPVSDVDNSVSVSAGTAYLAGMLTSIAAKTLAGEDGITRPTAGNIVIHSVIIDGSTGEYDIQPGTVGPAFIETRGENGGPPFIPVDSVEVAQIRLAGADPAPIVSGEIRVVPGVTRELFHHPIWTDNYATGEIRFVSPLPLIHTGNTPKQVWMQGYTPQFADLEPASDFEPPEESHSVSSTEVYGGAIAAISTTLDQGSFTVYLRDGITDPIIGKKNQKLWFKFFPHRMRAPHLLVQGVLGIKRTFPAGDSMQADCTLSADGPSLEMSE